jgi:hypothetical protein
LSNNQSRAPPRQNSEGRDRRRQEYHPAPYFSIEPPMPGAWGPPPMMYPPCPPWVGWYGSWTLPPMHFHLEWLGPIEDFGHRGYYTRNGRYGSVSHRQDRKASRQKNRTAQNMKPDHPVPSKTTEALGQPHKQSV